MGKEFNRGTVFRRLMTAAPLATRADRTVEYIFSDESVARDGDTIRTAGWDLDAYRANPVFLFAHAADQPPIGKVIEIGAVGTQLRGTVRYAGADEYPFADTIYRLTRGGYLNATSVSWLPRKWRQATDKSRPGGIDFLEQELLEISAVPVPSLTTALATARAAGIDVKPIAAWADSALDRGGILPKGELEMLRRAAGAPTKRYYEARAGGARGDNGGGVTVYELTWHNPFKTFGEFLFAVARSGSSGGMRDQRLVRAPTGLNESDPTAGGFAVPDAFTSELIGSLYEEALLAPLCDRREADKPNNASLPAIDETSRRDGSRWGGVLSYWDAEGVAPTTTLPRFKALKFNAAKLIALCVVTGELLEDVPLLDGHIRRAFAAEAAFQLDRAILLGTGAGVPLGIVGAPGTIQVAKDGSQTAGTISGTNIANMWSRLPAPSRKRAVWIVNEDAEAQLESLGTAGVAGAYYPAGADGNEFARIKGRPVIVAEQCPALGTPGDIALADLSQYIILDGGLRSALSLDVDFLSHQGVFRFVLRVDGKPAWQSPITSYNGTTTRSPFVTLAARS